MSADQRGTLLEPGECGTQRHIALIQLNHLPKEADVASLRQAVKLMRALLR